MRRTALIVLLIGTLGWAGQGTAAAAGCTIVGTNGNDTLTGTAGNDVLCGLGGNDRIYGKGGNDTLDGGAGNDQLRGGLGGDTFIGGIGSDSVLYDDHSAGVSVTLDARANDGSTGERDNVRSDLETVIGSGYADLLVGDSRANRLDGRNGADRILGQGGDDTLSGGNGNDLLRGGDGHDLVLGQAGIDSSFGDAGDDRITDDSGYDAVDAGPGIDACIVTARLVVRGCEARDTYVRVAGPSVVFAGVLRDDTGAPVVGATVYQGYWSSRTDATGAWGLLVPTGRATPLAFEVSLGSGRTARWSTEVAPTVHSLHTLVVPARRTVVVHAEDEAGTPIAGATVDLGAGEGLGPLTGLAGSAGRESGPSLSTDTAGDASFPSYQGVLRGLDVSVGPQHNGPVDAPVGADGRVLQVLDSRPAAVTGTVRDTTGAAVGNVAVTVEHGPVSGSAAAADGTFALAATRTRQLLQVKPFARAGRPRDLVLDTPVDLRSGDQVLDLTVPPTDTFVVHVQDLAGQPLAGATVALAEYEALNNTVVAGGRSWSVTQGFDSGVTDAGGDRLLPVVGATLGQLDVTLGSSRTSEFRHVAYNVAVQAGTLVVAVDTTTVTVSGSVAETTGVPLANSFVTWHEWRRSGRALGQGGVDGSFTMQAPHGVGVLRVTGDAVDGTPWKLNVSAQSTTLETDLTGPWTLPARVPVTLRVLDAAGQPVEGVRLDRAIDYLDAMALHPSLPTFYGAASLATSDLVTDAAGTVTFTALPGSVYATLLVPQPDGSFLTRYANQLRVSPGSAPLEVVLP